MSFRPLLKKSVRYNKKTKTYKYASFAILEYVDTDPSSHIYILPQLRGTFRLSLLPGTRDLEQLDAGGSRANVGIVRAIPEDNAEGLKEGDVVLFAQNSAPEWHSIHMARALAKVYDSEGKHLFFIPLSEIGAHLEDGIPEAGVVR